MLRAVRLRHLLIPLMLCASFPSQSSRFEPHYRPVLFVHGYGLSATTWSKMIEGLERRGYPAEYLQAVTIVPDDRSNTEAAEAVLRPAAQDLLRRARASAVRRGTRAPQVIDVVGHSMGAVSSRWYASRLEPERVGIWIGIAGANHGTNALCRFRRTPAGREMCPAYARTGARSLVQTTLNGTAERPADESPYGLGDDRRALTSVPADARRRIAYFTIRVEPDDWIYPASSALLDGAGTRTSVPLQGLQVEESPAGNFLVRNASHHDGLPENERVVELVWRVLSSREIGEAIRRD